MVDIEGNKLWDPAARTTPSTAVEQPWKTCTSQSQILALDPVSVRTSWTLFVFYLFLIFRGLRRLTVLDISDNKLWDPASLETLATLPELAVLYTSK